MLQRGSPGIESEVHIIVQEATYRCHIDVREANQSSGKVGRIVEGSKYASKLGVKQVLGE